MPLIKPLELAVNFTPTSREGPVPESGVAGTAVFGQIVHGQPGGGSGAMVMLNVACTVSFGLLESVTFTVKLVVPVAVGVPEITPPDESPSPAGKFDPVASAQVYGEVPPVAAKDWL